MGTLWQWRGVSKANRCQFISNVINIADGGQRNLQFPIGGQPKLVQHWWWGVFNMGKIYLECWFVEHLILIYDDGNSHTLSAIHYSIRSYSKKCARHLENPNVKVKGLHQLLLWCMAILQKNFEINWGMFLWLFTKCVFYLKEFWDQPVIILVQHNDIFMVSRYNLMTFERKKNWDQLVSIHSWGPDIRTKEKGLRPIFRIKETRKEKKIEPNWVSCWWLIHSRKRFRKHSFDFLIPTKLRVASGKGFGISMRMVERGASCQ